jgi:anti-anti-sigma regulatory factor
MIPDPRAEVGFHGPQGVELATTFARALLALVEADTDDAVLRAVASAVGSYGPSLIRFYTLRDDPGDPGPHDPRFLDRSGPRPRAAEPGADNVPTHAELSSVWQAGICPATDPLLGRPFALADHPVLARWLAAPRQALVLHDLAADPRLSAQPGERQAQALVVLPLTTGGPEPRWPGVLVLSWKIVHIPSPRERLVYDMLGAAVASFLVARDALRDHQRAIDEANTIYVAALALAEAADIDETLAALAEPAQAIEAQTATLWLRDPADPTQLALRAGGEPARRPLAELAGLFARPNEPWLFEQVQADAPPEIEPGAPRPAGSAHGATLLLPLAWGGQEVALLELGWATPRPLPTALRRLYAALAGPAAVTLAGRALLAQALAAASAGGAGLDAVPVAAVLAGDGGLRGNAAWAALNLPQGPDSPLHAALAAARESGQEVRREVSRAPTLTAFAAPLPGVAGAVVAVLLDTGDDTRAERQRNDAREALLERLVPLQAQRAVPALPLVDGLTVIPLVGALDEARAEQLREVAGAVAPGPRTVILDFTGVTSVEPATAAVVHEAAHGLVARGASVLLSAVPPALSQALAFERADTLGDALASALTSPRA